MRLKNYLITEARDMTKGKGVTWEEIKDIEKQLSRSLRPDMTQKITRAKMRGEDAWDLDFRVYDLFTPRSGEEDDDWPDFTGRKQLDKILKQHLKGIGYEVHPSEKYWFSVLIKSKKLTKKDQRSDARKEKDKVWRELRYAEINASDRFKKEQYNETGAALKKLRKKFIKKTEFFELAKKANWRWDADDLENFWRDITMDGSRLGF